MKDTNKHQGLRNQLAKLLEEKGITDKNVLEAIKKIPRHLFLNSSEPFRSKMSLLQTIHNLQWVSGPEKIRNFTMQPYIELQHSMIQP